MAPHKFARGLQPGHEDASEVYRVVELRQALLQVYRTDAHLVAYLVEGASQQPRVNKPGLELLGKRVTVGVFFCDVDNPGHAPWTEETFLVARQQEASLPSLQTAGVYYTLRGRRIVQPLAEAVEVQLAEAYLRRWLKQLEVEGLAVDWACRDWTRHFRLPNVPREARGRSRCVDLDRMAPIKLAPLEPEEQQAPQACRKQPRVARSASPAVAAPIAWTSDLPAVWLPVARTIAAAVSEVQTEWHALFLALAGALLARQVPPEHVPAFCQTVSELTGSDSRTADRIQAARTTVERWRTGLARTSAGTLRARWPRVAEAVEQALATGREARARTMLAAPVPVSSEPQPTLEETVQRLEQALRQAPDGLTVLQAGCGLGKTRAAERIAAERAAKPLSPGASGLRAPLDSKTSLSVDKHALAGQVVRHLRELGTPVGWHFGPLARRNDDGSPVCRYHEVALPLVEGGQSMQWELCHGRDLTPCEWLVGCPAARGYEGPDNPRVHVGPHALLPKLEAQAGQSGLLVIDEPPPVLETLVLTPGDLRLALDGLDAFEGAYGAALRPALEALLLWVEGCQITGQPSALDAVVQTYEPEVDPSVLAQARRASRQPEGSAVACARAAPVREEGPRVPPLRWVEVQLARSNREKAQRLGRVSRVLRTIHDGLTSKTSVAVRLEGQGEARQLHVTRLNETFCQALRREGPVVVLDASADLWAPVYAKIVGYERPLQRFHAPDGAPIERTMLHLGSATRTGWQPGGELTLAPSLRNGLRQALDWALEAPGNGLLAVITLPLLRLAIESCLAPDDLALEARWKEAKQRPEVLEEARRALGPLLRQWPGEIRLGHYGATRGLDIMVGVDNLVTLGDPWPNLDEVHHACAYLGLDEPESRYEALCRAELEQAHGRLRTVHRRRPGRALHVGSVVPGGPGWHEDQPLHRRARQGRPWFDGPPAP